MGVGGALKNANSEGAKRKRGGQRKQVKKEKLFERTGCTGTREGRRRGATKGKGKKPDQGRGETGRVFQKNEAGRKIGNRRRGKGNRREQKGKVVVATFFNVMTEKGPREQKGARTRKSWGGDEGFSTKFILLTHWDRGLVARKKRGKKLLKGVN